MNISKVDRIVAELGFEINKPKKSKTQQAATPNKVQGRDLFQTPNYAVDLLIPYIPNLNWVWEPASGDGRIARRLFEKTSLDVFVSDIRYSEEMPNELHNFLEDKPTHPVLLDWLEKGWGAIITNPPFSLKTQFYRKCREYNIPFALLLPADYSQWIIDAVRFDGAEKIIPTSRISFLTPNMLQRINFGESANYSTLNEIPQELLYKYSSAQFHSFWLTWGFNLGKTETYVELSLKDRKENIV